MFSKEIQTYHSQNNLLLVCKHTVKNLGTLCFSSAFLGFTQHKYSLLPKTIPPNQVLRKQLCILLLPKGAAFPESLNMVQNQVSA